MQPINMSYINPIEIHITGMGGLIGHDIERLKRILQREGYVVTETPKPTSFSFRGKDGKTPREEYVNWSNSCSGGAYTDQELFDVQEASYERGVEVKIIYDHLPWGG